jgi:hypothetical protein
MTLFSPFYSFFLFLEREKRKIGGREGVKRGGKDERGKETGVRKRRQTEVEMMRNIIFTEKEGQRISEEQQAKGDQKKIEERK